MSRRTVHTVPQTEPITLHPPRYAQYSLALDTELRRRLTGMAVEPRQVLRHRLGMIGGKIWSREQTAQLLNMAAAEVARLEREGLVALRGVIEERDGEFYPHRSWAEGRQ
ncbi:MAG: hypothetical protein AB7R89_31355 [Dehalococcoidia bacterium]